jgi:hypothetical protein
MGGEYTKYKNRIEKSFDIINKDGDTKPFLLNPAQDTLLNELSGMDIVLKSRQQGISSLILAMFAIDFLSVENVRCVVISHEAKATQRLFDRVKYYIESFAKKFPGDAPFTLKVNTRGEMINEKNNASFYVGTAGARAFGRGDTINNLHVSELPQWQNQERTLTGLLEAVPRNGRIIIEATANGFGDYFYNLWERNKERPSPFMTHFLPWFKSPEYTYPLRGDEIFLDGHPSYGDEVETMNKYHLTKEQMAWRRMKIDQFNGSLDKFNQEYPASAEEAFIVSGNPIWSPTMLRFYILKTKAPKVIGNIQGLHPITVERNERGYVSIWETPNEFHRYVIGADVSEGKVVAEGDESKSRDYSCAQVIDQNTMEQVAVWHGRLEPDLFGRQIDLLGRYYNNALVAVERNAMGLTTLTALRDIYYPNLYYREKFGLISEKVTNELGWVTDSSSRELAITDTTKLLRDRRLMLYDPSTLMEMKSFVRDERGVPHAAASSHDDRVMSLVIAVEMLGKNSAEVSGNPIERTGLAEGIFTMNGVTFGRDGQPADPENYSEDDISVDF